MLRFVMVMFLRARQRLFVIAALWPVGLLAQRSPNGPGDTIGTRDPDGTVVAGDLGRRLDAAVAKTMPGFWGTVLVAQQGRLVLARGYGRQDHARLPNGPHSLFDLGGMSMQITAAAALELAAARKWQLDDPVRKFVPDWPADKAAVTIRHLLQHTSGLPPEGRFEAGAEDARRTALAAIARAPLVDKPGAACRLSPLNANLLAILIEQVGNAPFEDVVRRRLLQPAGMEDAVFVGERRIDLRKVTFRRRQGEEKGLPATDFPWNWSQRGARGVLASALDLHALALALTSGKLLDAAALDVLWAPLPGGDVHHVQPVAIAGGSLVEVHGAVTGYRARLIVDRTHRSWIALLGGEVDLGPLVQALAQELLAEEAAGGPPAGAAAAAAGGYRPTAVELARFAGAFALPSGGRFEVRAAGGALAVTGIGLQASARLQFGGWPPAGKDAELRRCEDRGLELLRPIVDGADAAFTDAFASDDARVRARAAWRELAGTHARSKQLEFVGTEWGPPRVSWFRLAGGEKEPVALRVSWAGDRFADLAAAAAPLPFTARFALLRADVAAARIGGVPVTLTVEGEGAARVLVLEDASPDPVGLIECTWQADLR